MNVRIGATAVVGLCLLTGCTAGGGYDGRDRDPANRPGYALPGDSSRSGAPAGHTVRGPADAIRNGDATFELVNGSDVVRVRVGDLNGDLFEVSTPDDSKVKPAVDADGRTVVAGLRATGEPGPAVVNVVLSDDVRWTVRLAGGAEDEAVDLTGGPGGNVDFSAGTSRAAAALPAGSGTQRVTMSGGASQFVVRLAGNGPVRVAAGSGAGSVTIDGDTRSGVAGGSLWTPAGWESSADRYDVDATAGVSTFTVERG
jgi:hypothetical protein